MVRIQNCSCVSIFFILTEMFMSRRVYECCKIYVFPFPFWPISVPFLTLWEIWIDISNYLSWHSRLILSFSAILSYFLSPLKTGFYLHALLFPIELDAMMLCVMNPYFISVFLLHWRDVFVVFTFKTDACCIVHPRPAHWRYGTLKSSLNSYFMILDATASRKRMNPAGTGKGEKFGFPPLAPSTPAADHDRFGNGP